MSSPDQAAVPILELRRISKAFPGVQALDQVYIVFRRGEVHAGIPENGSGWRE